MSIESRLTALETLVGSLTEAQNDKVDRDCQNVDTTSGADIVVEYKLPTSADPTWYRVYKSGWIEQGGTIKEAYSSTFIIAITFLKEMKDIYYTATTAGQYGDIGTNDSSTATRRVGASFGGSVRDRTTTGFNMGVGSVSHTNCIMSWEVKGMGAQT